MALARLLRTRWGLTGVTVSERLQTYCTRFVLRIVSDQGGFAVKVDLAPGPVVTGSEQFQAVLAAAMPDHVPAVLPDRAGALVALDEGWRVTVSEDIAGGQPESDVATWRGLGEVLARLHALPPVERRFGIPIGAAADELWRMAYEFPFGEGIRELIPRVRRIAELPEATIHGEVNTSNVLRRAESGVLVLVDWDHAGAGPIAVELGYPLLCCFLGEDLRWWQDQSTAFYREYVANSTVELPAAGQIFDAAVLHALRYLKFGDTVRRWTRLRYAIEHEDEFVDHLAHALAAKGGSG